MQRLHASGRNSFPPDLTTKQRGGGGENDRIRVVLRSITTGRTIIIADGTIGDIVAADPLKGLIDLAKRFDDFREDYPAA